MNDVDNPLEPFKRATTAAIRAIAENDELDVNFGPGAPTAQGDRIRLPLPSQGASAAEIDAVRGIEDEYALRYRHHNAQLHARFSPQGGPAQRCSNGLNPLVSHPWAPSVWRGSLGIWMRT